MNDLPRVMVIAWRWGNSEIYRLPDDQTHLEWLLDRSGLSNDRFLQVDLHAEIAEEPLRDLVSHYLASSDVLLFLHDNQDYGYSPAFRDRLLSSLARKGGTRAGRLYTRLFTGGREPVYCTPHFPMGILGSNGTFGSDLTGFEEDVFVVRSFNPETGERVLNFEHFDAVWEHYWQHAQQSEKLGNLTCLFGRWAMKHDNDLYKDTGGYPSYLKKDPELWKALASFAQNHDALDRLARNNESLDDFQDFSDFGAYIEVTFADSNGQPSEAVELYQTLQQDTLHQIFYAPIDDHEALTEDLYNRMDRLHLMLSRENF